jgi:hypothetical protein
MKNTYSEWAAHEVELACKRENPDWDGKSFDYGCACYQSALKAVKSLCEDEHSGFSWAVTANIVTRLINHLPLLPITEEDFPSDECDSYITSVDDIQVKTTQCQRMSSLFKREYPDGIIKYEDIDRAICYNTHDANHSGFSSRKLESIIDENFPITLPYMPELRKYKVYCEEFLMCDENGNFDHQRITSYVEPNGKEHTVHDYNFREIDGKMIKCTEEEWIEDWKVYLKTK